MRRRSWTGGDNRPAISGPGQQGVELWLLRGEVPRWEVGQGRPRYYLLVKGLSPEPAVQAGKIQPHCPPAFNCSIFIPTELLGV